MVNISLLPTSMFIFFSFFLLRFYATPNTCTIQIISSCKINAPVFAYLSAIRLLIIIYFTRFFLFSSFLCKWQVVQLFFFFIVVCCFAAVAMYWIWCRIEKKIVANTKKPSIITEWNINVRQNLHRLKKSPERVEWKRKLMIHHHQHVAYIIRAAIYEITNYFFLTI